MLHTRAVGNIDLILLPIFKS
uniref:Uncharacterized protein n=1 Tax=Anguilla anguilla TaxID=7936 RepID=A0A0E9VJF7_ANGAN